MILLRKRLTEKKAEAESAKGFVATAIISAPSASAAGSAVVVATTATAAAATNSSASAANPAHTAGTATMEIVSRQTKAIVGLPSHQV